MISVMMLGLGWAVAPAAFPQANEPPPIRVESKLVVVRALVIDKKLLTKGVSEGEIKCEQSEVRRFLSLKPTEPFLPKICGQEAAVVRDLAADKFHVFVDAKEQKIQSVMVEAWGIEVRDNSGRHAEWSRTPAGAWSTTDLPGTEGILAPPLYNIAFVPPLPERVGCHSVKIAVDRRNALVYARDEYCDGQSPWDILTGTAFGNRIESDLASAAHAEILLSLQAGFFRWATDKVLVHVALEFPWRSLHREWKSDWSLHAAIGVLGLIYKKDGNLAARFSDFGCCSAELSLTASGWEGLDFSDAIHESLKVGPGPPINPVLDWLKRGELKAIPARYETQIGLPPGDYKLRIVLSDGEKIGFAEAPLNITKYDDKELALSSLMLCKRFRDAHVAAAEATAANFAPQYAPLVSKDIQVTPTGDTRFKRGEPLIAYFEVYEPLPAAQPATAVQARVRIVNAKTGEMAKDFPQVDVMSYQRPGTTIFPVAREIPVDKLPKSSYRLEVQATDSAGRSTVWRSANFTVE
jgi:hypothetical protein